MGRRRVRNFHRGYHRSLSESRTLEVRNSIPHAADILLTVSETHRPIIITHNGVGKMVIQDIESYEKIKERLTLLKIAALGKRAVEEGDFRPAKEVFRSIEKQRKRNA